MQNNDRNVSYKSASDSRNRRRRKNTTMGSTPKLTHQNFEYGSYFGGLEAAAVVVNFRHIENGNTQSV